MSDTHNKLQYGNNNSHWKILDLVLDLNYFYFSNPNPNPTHLRKHQTLSLIISFFQRSWCRLEYLSAHAHMALSQKLRLTSGCASNSPVQPHTFCAPLLVFKKTLAQPHFAVVNLSGAVMSVYYSPVLTHSLIFLQLWTAAS